MSSAELFYKFIEICEKSDLDMIDFSKEGLERNPDSTINKETIQYHDGRARAFKFIKEMMPSYFPQELSNINHEPLTV